MPKLETRTYKITGRKEDLNTLEKLLAHIESLNNACEPKTLMISVDNDGFRRITIRNENGDRLTNNCDGEFSGHYEIG